MKIGNFVGQTPIEFTDTEKKGLLDHFTALGKKLVPDFKSCFIDVNTIKRLKKLGVRVTGLPVVIERAKLHTGRNDNGDRIANHDGFTFMVRKNAGYLDETDWHHFDGEIKRNYKDAPKFSYGCTGICDGSEIKYKCRTKQCIQVAPPYQYGTEISDLDFADFIRKHVKHTKIVKAVK